MADITRRTLLAGLGAGVVGAALGPRLAWAANPVGTTYPATTRSLVDQPFGSSSPWNTSLLSAAGAQAAGVGWSANRDARTNAITSSRPRAWINCEEYSIPVHRASASDPLTTVTYPRTPGQPVGSYSTTFRCPAAAVGANGTDRHCAVIDVDGITVHELYDFQGTGTNRTAYYYVANRIDGSGYGTGPDQLSTRASGLSSLGGLIRVWDVLDLQARAAQNPNGDLFLRHALALAITNGQLKAGPVAPANSQDGDAASSYTGAVPMGSLVGIPASVDLTRVRFSYPGWPGRALARTLQTHGAYVVDRSGSFVLYAEPDVATYSAATADLLAGFRRDFDRIRPYLRVVATPFPRNPGAYPALLPAI